MKKICVVICWLVALIIMPNIAYGGTEGGSTVYNTTISWGDMAFSYDNDNAIWDSDEHTYIHQGEGEWSEKTLNSSGNISISNSSNCEVRIGTKFVANIDSVMDKIQGFFYIQKGTSDDYTSDVNVANFTMDAISDTTPTTKKIKFMPSGHPLKFWYGDKKVGTITIQLYGTDSTSLKMSEESTTINYGDTKQLSVLNNSESVTWTSVNPEIASVDSNGLVTANGVGITTIKAMVDDLILECKVTVISKKEVYLSKTSISLYPNETTTIELKGATSAPVWRSENTGVANITSTTTTGSYTATITAYVEGLTYIKAELNGEKFYIKVEVVNEKNESIPSDNYTMAYTTTDNEVEQTKSFATLKELKEFINGINNLKTVILENNPTYSDIYDCSDLFKDKATLEIIDLSYFNMKNVTNVNSMFENCTSLKTIFVGDLWVINNVTSSTNMFAGCINLVGAIPYDPSKVDHDYANAETGYLTLSNKYTLSYKLDSVSSSEQNKEFYSFNALKRAIQNEKNTIVSAAISETKNNNIQSVDASNLFSECVNLQTVDLSGFSSSNITNMSYMFKNCSSLTELDLSSFNTSQVTQTGYMFNACSSLRTIYVSGMWNVTNVTCSTNMFAGCINLVGAIPFDPSKVDHNYANAETGYLTHASKFTLIYQESSETAEKQIERFSSINELIQGIKDKKATIVTAKVTSAKIADAIDASQMFESCQSLKSVDLSEFRASNITNMHAMFYGCTQLTELNLLSFDTSKVTNMAMMFGQCKSLTSLDLTSFNTLNVLFISGMFTGCSKLQRIYVSNNWNVTKITEVNRGVNMFSGCDNLVGAISYNSSKVNHDNANYQTGYLTLKE